MSVEAELTIRNDFSELKRVSSFVVRFCSRNSALRPLEQRLALVLEELVSNSIKYGFDDQSPHEISVRFHFSDGALTAVYEDDGAPFDPTTAIGPEILGTVEERPVGGLGIHLVLTIMEAVDYTRVAGRNRLTMTMQAPG